MKKRINLSHLFSLTLFFIILPVTHSCQNDQQNGQVKNAPNILFAIADDASWEHFGAYGCNWISTPALDKVAGEGILFTRAYTPNAKCAPSRSCILTGLNSWQLKAAANHVPYFPTMFISFMEVLETHGYEVGFTGKGWAPGTAIDREGKFRQLTGKRYDRYLLTPPTDMISPKDYARNFQQFLEMGSLSASGTEHMNHTVFTSLVQV